MTLVLVRDDDANATTDPDRLGRTYASLLDAGIALNLAVIPRVALDTRAPDGRREGFVDPASPDEPRCVELGPDVPLARWLRAHEREVDVFVHGLTHERLREGTELGALDEAEARERLAAALGIVTAALGRVPVGFVAPWDALSRGALVAATSAFDLVSTGWVGLGRLPPLAWPAHVVERLRRSGVLRVGRGFVLRHGGCRIVSGTDPADVPAIVDSLCRHVEIAVVVLHHWHFDDPSPIRALATALRQYRTLSVREAVRHLDG